MFRCERCNSIGFVEECPACGQPQYDVDEIGVGFLQFLQTGKCDRPIPKPPDPFRQRLASYLGRDESEVMLPDASRSTMPLRVFTTIGPYRGPKSRWLIRFLLTRIHRIVRLTGHR